MKIPFRSGWAHRRPVLTALVVVAVVAVPGYWRLEQAIRDTEKTADALAAFVLVSAESTCQARRDFRDVLVDLVELSDDGTGLNLTAVPSFAALPESVKTYLRDLEARSNASEDPSAFVTEALALLEHVDCPDPTDLEEVSP